MVSIHCPLNTELLDWACSKLVYNIIERSDFIIFKSMLFHTIRSECMCFYYAYYYIPTPVNRTQEHGGLGDPLIAVARLFVVLMRLENKSFL